MIIAWENLMIIIIEIFCCINFFEVFNYKRNRTNTIKAFFLASILVLYVYIIVKIFSKRLFPKQLFVVIGMSIVMFLYFDIIIKKSLVLAALFQSILLGVDYLAFSLICVLFPMQEKIEDVNVSVGILIIIFGKITLFLVVLLIKKIIGYKSSEALADIEWGRFLFLPISTMIIIANMIFLFSYVDNQEQANLLIIIAIVLVAINIGVFWLIKDILRREIKIQENRILKLKIKSQTNLYHSISENFDKQKKSTHEYKNNLLCMQALIQDKEYEKLENYLEKINVKLKKEINAIDTNNIIINAIINTKYQEAIEKNIVFVVEVNDLSFLRIQEEDIVIILSNLLNNAIEGCEKCKTKKVIKLKFILENKQVILSVANTYKGEVFMEGNIFKTTKENEEEHGIGMYNIVDTIQKYHGSYVIKNNESEFKVSIIIPQ